MKNRTKWKRNSNNTELLWPFLVSQWRHNLKNKRTLWTPSKRIVMIRATPIMEIQFWFFVISAICLHACAKWISPISSLYLFLSFFFIYNGIMIYDTHLTQVKEIIWTGTTLLWTKWTNKVHRKQEKQEEESLIIPLASSRES